MIFEPAHIDGRTLVILKQAPRGFRPITSGVLSHDGRTLSLIGNGAEIPITDEELAAIQPVSSNCRIPECRGFDFFLIALS